MMPTHPEQQVGQTKPAVEESTEARAIRRRYRDAYRVAKATVAFGNAIEIVGIALAVLIVLGTLIAITKFRSDLVTEFRSDLALLVPGVLVAGFVGPVFYLIGVLVVAQGQTLLASLDTAVNSSPLLTNQQKAVILSLPKAQEPSAAAHGSGPTAQEPSAGAHEASVTLDDVQF